MSYPGAGIRELFDEHNKVLCQRLLDASRVGGYAPISLVPMMHLHGAPWVHFGGCEFIDTVILGPACGLYAVSQALVHTHKVPRRRHDRFMCSSNFDHSRTSSIFKYPQWAVMYRQFTSERTAGRLNALVRRRHPAVYLLFRDMLDFWIETDLWRIRKN